MLPVRNDRFLAMARIVKAASFMAASAISLTLMLFPFLLRHVPGTRLHAVLPLILFGVVGAFVHGIGFRPDHKPLRILFGPACAWTMIVSGAVLMLAP